MNVVKTEEVQLAHAKIYTLLIVNAQELEATHVKDR